MYEIRDERGRPIAHAGDFSMAEQRLEEICAQATRQATASGEGTQGMTLRWSIVEVATDRTAARMILTPDDTGRPYEPISQITPTTGAQQ